MELLILIALIFTLWLLVQLGVGIYHRGLQRGLRRWARGLPHLFKAVGVFTVKSVPLAVSGTLQSGSIQFRDRVDHHNPIKEDEKRELKELQSTIEYVDLGYTYEPPETRTDI